MPKKTSKKSAQSLARRGIELVKAGAYAAAIPVLRRALADGARDPLVPFALSGSLFKIGKIEATIRQLRATAQSKDAAVRRAALQKIAVVIPGDPDSDNAKILEARRQFMRLEAEGLERFPLRRVAWNGDCKLRVGYVCAFFGDRNWMKPVWGMLHAHNREEFEIHLFLEGEAPKKEYGFKPNTKDKIHSLDKKSNEEVAKSIAEAGIDILVDLNAFSQVDRMGLFLRKPAPVQVGWFNTYATSGSDVFDYAVADDVALPAIEERNYTERILRVRGSYLAYSVLYPVPEITAAPCTTLGRVTFGCLAPQYKLTREVITTFARILRAAPKAKLLLKNRCVEEPASQTVVRGLFRKCGVPDGQVICEGGAEHFEFLEAYSRIDVALDTFPYSGGTTTMEALWQGVPVMTFSGNRWLSRTSASLLCAAGLGSWVHDSREAFVQGAIAVARSREVMGEIAAMRMTMREKLKSSPVCDVAGLCRQLEGHYRDMAAKA